jgi:hypothetical protein
MRSRKEPSRQVPETEGHPRPEIGRGRALAPGRAVLVLLHARPKQRSRRLSGRVEHVTSGRAAEFANGAELLAFLNEVATTE